MSKCCVKIVCAIAFCVINILVLLSHENPNAIHKLKLKTSNRKRPVILNELKDTFFVQNGKEKILWPENKTCSQYKVRFAVRTNLVYLFSFPRSGNTWSRYLLEASTGIFSGAVYNDKRAYELGFYGEKEPHRSGRTVPIKTHAQALWSESTWSINKRMNYISPDDPVILLIRHPKDAVMSFYSLFRAAKFSKTRSNETLFYDADESSYDTKDFRKFVKFGIRTWTEINMDRLLWTKNLLVVFYENLLTNPIHEVQRMTSFMGFSVSKKRLACVKAQLEGPAKRKHRDHGDKFLPEEDRLIGYSIGNLAALCHIRNISLPSAYMHTASKYSSIFNE